MKTLAIFGATGRTGSILLKKAIEEGYRVKVLARNPDKLLSLANQIEIVQGAIEEIDKVNEIVAGSDAVISVIGHKRNSRSDVQTNGIKNILESMEKFKVRRIISLTGTGVSAAGDNPKTIDRVLTLLIKVFAPSRFTDGCNHAELLKTSGTYWTIVRTPLQLNKTGRNKYKIGMVDTSIGWRISRYDIADFILKIVDDKTYYKSMPAISW